MFTTPWRSVFNVDAPQFTRLYQFWQRHRHILHLTTIGYGTGYDQHLHIARQVEPIITKHNHLQFRIQHDTPSHTYVHMYHHTPGYEHLCLRRNLQCSTLSVEWKSPWPPRCVSNFHIYTETDKHKPWLRRSGHAQGSTALQLPSPYNSTVSHLRRSGWLEVKTVEADSTMDSRD